MNSRRVFHCVPILVLPCRIKSTNRVHDFRWGNTPAVDVINLTSNENDAKKDFSLAFIGVYSG